MGADKILAQMKEAEDFMKEAQNNAKTFFEKQSKKEKKDLDYRFRRDEDLTGPKTIRRIAKSN